ncbi:MAG: PAS domain S-box protein [Desulfobacterales bacterium]
MRSDITQRKLAEEALKQIQQHYRNLFEEAPVMYVITRNQDGVPVIVDCNALFLSALGYTISEVLKHPLADFYTSQSRTELLECGGYQRALKNRFTQEDRQLVAKDGRIIETMMRAVPEIDKDEQGNVKGALSTARDITEQRQIEMQLRMKIDELQRWNKAVMGREMRVIELKREVNELLVKSGQHRVILPAISD